MAIAARSPWHRGVVVVIGGLLDRRGTPARCSPPRPTSGTGCAAYWTPMPQHVPGSRRGCRWVHAGWARRPVHHRHWGRSVERDGYQPAAGSPAAHRGGRHGHWSVENGT